MPDNSLLRELREHFPDWFLLWKDGRVYALPRCEDAPRFGKMETLEVTDLAALRLLSGRLTDELPSLIGRESLRHRPYTFLGGVDAVEDIATRLKLPPLARQFHIRSKFELDVRILELVNDVPFLGFILERHTRWSISAALGDLQAAKIDLRGLFAVRREPGEGEKRLVGRIGCLRGDVVELDEAFDERTSFPSSELALEGTRHSFARCLQVLLGPAHENFNDERERWEAEKFAATEFEQLLEKVGKKLQHKTVHLGGLDAWIGGRITLRNSSDYRSIVNVGPVECCFDPAKTKRDDLPWRGLEKFGPFSRDTFSKRSPRVWVFCPDNFQGNVETFVRSLRGGITLPDYKGHPQRSNYSKSFAQLYGLANPEFIIKKVGVFHHARPETALRYRAAVEESLAEAMTPETAPDVAIVVVPDKAQDGSGSGNSYLQAKAMLLMAGVPVQGVQLSTVLKRPHGLQHANQGISLSLYAKMGGTPWTIANDPTVHDELVIGMGTVEMSDSRFSERQRYIGITTVFSGEGNYLLGSVSKDCAYSEYPQVLREATLEVLRKIKERNDWRQSDRIRIVFHAYKPLKNVEVGGIIAECVDTLRSEHEIEFAFLNISQDHPFHLFDPLARGEEIRNSPGRKGALVPARGTIAQLGRFSRLVCTRGPRLMRKASMPQPLLVHLHPRSTYHSLDYLAEQVLKFTALSWRSTHPASGPVTIFYSELIAGLLARLKTVDDWSPAMLNVKLSSSRWFL